MVELKLIFLGAIIFILHAIIFSFIDPHPLRAVVLFGFVYFVVCPLIGIYLSWHFVSKGLNVVESSIKVAAFFFIILFLTYLIDDIYLLLSNKPVVLSELAFNFFKSVIAFTLVAFFGSLFFSFVSTKLKKADK